MAVAELPSASQNLESQFLEHWKSLPRDGAVPTLSTFLDRPSPKFAPWTYILDIANDEQHNVRLFGTRMVDLFGEVTGLNFLDFLARDARQTVSRAHRLICDTPCGWVTHARAVTTTGRVVIPKNVTFPLFHKGEIRTVVKLCAIVQEQDYRESLVSVDKVDADHWIDLGAGIPPADALARP